MKTSSTPIQTNPLPISRLFPNIITLSALCFGMSAIRFAMLEKWENSVIFIIIAALLDGIDGKLARLLKASTSFGAQLDSLADFLSFGIAPALVLYLWQLQYLSVKGLGWAVTLFYTICCVIRLARFNTIIDDSDRPAWTDKFFVGVPSPVGASLALVPMMLDFQYEIFNSPILVALYLMIVGLLMASRVPTFYVKKILIKHNLISIALMLAGIVIVSIIIEPWITLPLIGLIYVISIPVSIYKFKKFKDKI
ncbi:MAG: CDP-alcohol phosphatidyltransferase family protein [Alphaproteobacteria bacterium]